MNTKEKENWKEAVDYAINKLVEKSWHSKYNSTRYNLVSESTSFPPKRIYHHAIKYMEKQYPEVEIPVLRGGKPTNRFLENLGFEVIEKTEPVNDKLQKALNAYIEYCQTTDWLKEEQYKFEWARWLNEKVNFENQTDAEILQICIESQNQEYTGTKEVQFIKQGAREKLSKYIGIDDVRYFRKYYEGNEIEDIDFSDRNMSYPIVSCYLSVFFPDDLYPASKTDFANSVEALFDENMPKNEVKFVMAMQEPMLRVEEVLFENSDYTKVLQETFALTSIKQLDRNWAVQDFFLFLSRESGVFDTFYHNEDELIVVLQKTTRVNARIYFNFLDSLKDHIQLTENDPRFVLGTSLGQLNLTIGQRYCWNLYPNRQKGTFGIVSTKSILDSSEPYDGKPQAFYTYLDDASIVHSHLEIIINAIKKELERTHKSGFNKYNNVAFEKALFDIGYRQTIFEKAYGAKNYFLVGAYWGGNNPADQTNDFLNKGIWQNGYEDKFREEVNNVKVGDAIAIKAAYTRERKKSVMLIKARGVVIKNQQDGQHLTVAWEENFKPFEVDFSGGYWATIKMVKKKEHINAIWNTTMKKQLNGLKRKNSPINQILYGPPGTGKTYKLQAEYFSEYTISETNLTKEQHIETIFNDLSWFQVITLIVLELEAATVSEIMEHPFFPLKSKSSSAKNLRAQVWGNLQSHTVENCEQVKYTRRVNPLIFNKDEDGTWTIVSKELEELFPEAIEMLTEINNFQPRADKRIRNFEFVTFHQSFSYEDFVEGIKPKMVEGETDLGYEIEDGVFKKLCIRAKADPDNNYAIFIDEINRGNVSAIFGELITLIEKDKRAGAKNALEVQLPYSKEKFSVPNNLHIYGTMNTADRSVEALDTALRRRFEFKEMMPNVQVIDDEVVDGISLSEILKTINERIELLIDRDHTIGHSYFINVATKEALANAFNNKIVPLLQEYFYGDYGKIGLVLGQGFVEKLKNDNINFASFNYDNANDFKTPTFILKRVTSDSIIDAVNILLAKKEIIQNQ